MIDGDRVFYHYLQKDLRRSDIWIFQMLAARLVVALGIWLHPSIYAQLPVLLPFAVRDPEARGNKSKGILDQWGSPNQDGLFRDDNSLVKGLPRSLLVQSPGRLYKSRRIGNGFVASHVWREVGPSLLAARDKHLFSFVPNLIWLPGQVAALTDREGSFVQTYVQAIAHHVYRPVAVRDSVREIVESLWERLPVPAGVPEEGLPNEEDLNFFLPSNRWLSGRVRTISAIIRGLESSLNGTVFAGKMVSARYADGLAKLGRPIRQRLFDDLRAYLAELGA